MKERIGLVLEGGAMRGMYTTGVLDVLMDNQIGFDAIVGVSAGALFGVNFVAGQRSRALRYSKKYNSDKNYMGILPLIKEGNLISTDYAYRKVPFELDPFDVDAFNKSNVPFYAVLTDVETGEPAYRLLDDIGNQMDTLRASASMPIVSKSVEVDGRQYLDGGVSDSIPYEFFLGKGFEKEVIVLTRDINYVKKPFSKVLANLTLRKYPGIRSKMISRHLMYNEKIAKIRELEQEGKVFVIRPSLPIEISKTEKDPEKLQQVYDMGVSDCLAALDALKAYLAK